jgi:hypothetical protein
MIEYLFAYKLHLVVILMIYNIARRTFGCLTHSLRNSYGELTYTTSLNFENGFNRIPTFRLIDLEGKLLDSSHVYDVPLLTRILKTMIFTD